MPPHTTRPLQITRQGCQKKTHGHYTVRNSKRTTLAITTPVYSLNRAFILLPFSPASALNQISKSPAYAAYLNSLYHEPFHHAAGDRLRRPQVQVGVLMPLPGKEFAQDHAACTQLT